MRTVRGGCKWLTALSDCSIGAPECLQGLCDHLCLLTGLIGWNCLPISENRVNIPSVKFTSSNRLLNRNRLPLSSASLVVFQPDGEEHQMKVLCLQRLSRMTPITMKPLCLISWCLQQARPSRSSPPALTQEARTPWPWVDGWHQQFWGIRQ